MSLSVSEARKIIVDTDLEPIDIDRITYDTEPYKAGIKKIYQIENQFFLVPGFEDSYSRETYWSDTREVFKKEKAVTYYE